MQAQLELKRSPVGAIIVAFSLAAALLLGGSLGYVIRPATVVNQPARVVVVHDESALYATGDTSSAYPESCVWTTNPRHKDC
jgi:hypothetical protein